MFDTFANGKNVFVRGQQLVIHMDAFTAGQVDFLRQSDIGANADRHDQLVTGQFGAIVKHQGFDFAVLADDLLGVGRAFHGDALVNQGLA